MGVLSSPLRAPGTEPGAAPVEPRETGGVTTRLICDYVEREAGRDGVDRMLALCGLAEREPLLRDENHWSSFETKINLLEAAAEVLGDPLAARHIGAAGMDFNIAPGLKLSLRALGTVRLLYRNIPRTCAKFSTTHRMEALDVGSHYARIAYINQSDKGYHPADCELNVGFLSCGPSLFGLPNARVSHPVCARDGGDRCIYEVRWDSGASRLRKLLGSALFGAGVLGAAAIAEPGLLPEAAALAGAASLRAVVDEARFRYRRLQLLEARAESEAEASQRLATSLQDLVSDLRLDEVLGKVTTNAQVAVNGKDFVLLVNGEDGNGMRCSDSSRLPADAVEAIERWANASPSLATAGAVIDDLGEVPELRDLPRHGTLPLGSLASAPLVFRGSPLGMLVALSNGPHGFLPHDVELLQSYGAQAAIALTNARLYQQQEQLATRDPLTGLLNHREFHEAVERKLEACRRNGGDLNVILLDLDGFKQVNDTAGHAAGDLVLTGAANMLRGCCRAGDLAFRVGGDEFALVLCGPSSQEVIRVAERAAEAIRKADSRVSASYGIAGWPGDGPSKDSVLARADERLYAMKRAGQDRLPSAPAPTRAGDQHERLACASRLSARVAPLLEPKAIVAAAVEELDSTFGYELTVVMKVGADRVLRPVSGAGPQVARVDFEGWSQSLDSGVGGRVARTGEPALVADATLDPDYIQAGGVVLHSLVCVPIRVAGDIWGILQLHRREPAAFDFDDLVFADLLGAHIGAALDRSRLFGELEGTFMTTLGALCDALERKDAYTAEHAREVEDLSDRVGRRLGLEGEDLRHLRYGALLHDIGKIGIASEILNKPGELTEEEFDRDQAAHADRRAHAGAHPVLRRRAPAGALGARALGRARLPGRHRDNRDPAGRAHHLRLRRLPRDDLEPALQPRPLARRGGR